MNHEIDPEELELEEGDGPLTCMWKLMYGKGWLSVKQIIELMSVTKFAPVTVRNKIFQFPDTTIEGRLISPRPPQGKPKEYRILPGSRPPAEATYITTRPRGDVDTGMNPEKLKKAMEAMREASKFVDNMTRPHPAVV